VPTVTDANLLLGYLDPAGLAGGVSLSPALAEDAVDRVVAGPLGATVADAAHAIHAIVNAAMAAAIRVVTVQRGIDPRDFRLVGFGGAGPMHAARLAATFGIGSVLVPWGAGVAAAIGLVSSDLTVELVQTRVVALEDADPLAIAGWFEELEARGRDALAASGDEVVVTRAADLRFRGQAHQLTVPLPDGSFEPEGVSSIAKRFHEVYRQAYGIDADAPVQLVNLRVRVVRVVEKPQLAPATASGGDARSARVGERPASFVEAGGFVTTPVYDWRRCEPGLTFEGPAIVEGPDATIVVPPAHRATVDPWRNVVLELPDHVTSGVGP
jgi:N-methylhydantoinase A